MDKSKNNITMQIEHLLYRSITSNKHESFYAKDLNSKFLAMSQYHASYFGLDSIEEGIGKTDFDFFTREHAQEAFEDEQEIIRTKKPILAKVEKETWKDDYVSYVITSKYPLLDDEDNVIGTWGHTINVATHKNTSGPIKQKRIDSKDFQKHLDEASKIDPLTKLKNIKSFYELMNLFYQSAMNTMNMPSVSHCLMIIDVNNYGLINATHGQEVADTSILTVANYLKELQSPQLHVFRYSGDRFAILYEVSAYDKSIELAHSIVEKIAKLHVLKEDQTSIEINIGLSQFRESLPFGDIYDIINLTDKRLYASQKLINKTVVYDDSY